MVPRIATVTAMPAKTMLASLLTTAMVPAMTATTVTRMTGLPTRTSAQVDSRGSTCGTDHGRLAVDGLARRAR